jgi:DNA-binding Xre family transcriptional regulator
MIAPSLGAQLCVALHCAGELEVQPNGQDVLTRALVASFAVQQVVVLKVGAVTARFRHHIEAGKVALRGNAIRRLAIIRAARHPLTSFGRDFDGLDGPGIVCADGDAHRAGFPKCTLVFARNQYKFRTTSGQACIDRVLIGRVHLWRTMDEPPPSPLAAIRKRQLLSQRALAQRAGVALSTIYLLEAARTERVTFKVMRAVSAALGVPPASIAEFRRAMGMASNST